MTWPSSDWCLKALWRVFVDSLIDNNERVASFKYTLPNARLECKKHISSDQNGENQHPNSD